MHAHVRVRACVCVFARPLHAVSAWPHLISSHIMYHIMGALHVVSTHSPVLRAVGASTPADPPHGAIHTSRHSHSLTYACVHTRDSTLTAVAKGMVGGYKQIGAASVHSRSLAAPPRVAPPVGRR